MICITFSNHSIYYILKITITVYKLKLSYFYIVSRQEETRFQLVSKTLNKIVNKNNDLGLYLGFYLYPYLVIYLNYLNATLRLHTATIRFLQNT